MGVLYISMAMYNVSKVPIESAFEELYETFISQNMNKNDLSFNNCIKY